MEETLMTETDNQMNIQKYKNYKEQFKRLDRAVNYGFNLEAMFISYAIMEDRAESVLRHADKYEAYVKSRKGRQETIDSKLRYIIKLSESKKDLLNKYFADELLENILIWKEERNRMIHALMKQQLTTEELEKLAIDGKEFARKFSNKATNYRRAVERQRKDSKL